MGFTVESRTATRPPYSPWTTAHQASLFITNSRSLPKLMSTELVIPSNHLILCCPLLLLPPIPPSIRVFSNESVLHIRWPKYWSFSFSISSSNEHPGLISFQTDWLDLLAVQGTLKSLLQHHSSKASIQGFERWWTTWTSNKLPTLWKSPWISSGSAWTSKSMWRWEMTESFEAGYMLMISI